MTKGLIYSLIHDFTASFASYTPAPGIDNPFLIRAPSHNFFKSFWDDPKPEPSWVTKGLTVFPSKSNCSN